MENVVAEYKTCRIVAYKLFADYESLCQTVETR